MRVIRGLLAAVAMAGLATGLAAPAAAQQATQDARTGAVLEVPINKSQTLRVGQRFAKAVVGNAEIADVLPLSTSSVYVLGRGIGATNLSLYDGGGGLIAVVDIVVGPDSQGLKAKLAELAPTEAVAVTASNGSIVLSGEVSSAAAAERIVTIAETYAPKKVVNMLGVSAVQQVLLEVKFSEMSRSTVKQLGINRFSFDNSTILTPGSNGGIVTSPDSVSNPFFLGLNLPNASNLLINIDALERQGLVRTLAEPNLVALSGETAAFLAGGEFPIPTNVQVNGQVAIEFKQFGVSLAFTPTVLEDGLINLLVGPEVSQLDPSAGIELSGIRIPGLKVRRARTTVELRDGQSFALAGLIQNDFADTVRAIPLLGRIPIIGALFRSTAYNKSETELVMIVTPRLVRPVAAGSLAVPTDRVFEPSDLDIFLNGKTERRVAPSAPGMPGMMPGAGAPVAASPAGDFGHVIR
ncbi:MAG: type II and III secretion system protein family protein [Polymorphobacter sp.]|uniref:type II and III secretion system protein family protein n=1 Tax=Polymorphobacter sp. TaxID=1909290 RepID=UPI003A899CF0